MSKKNGKDLPEKISPEISVRVPVHGNGQLNSGNPGPWPGAGRPKDDVIERLADMLTDPKVHDFMHAVLTQPQTVECPHCKGIVPTPYPHDVEDFVKVWDRAMERTRGKVPQTQVVKGDPEAPLTVRFVRE